MNLLVIGFGYIGAALARDAMQARMKVTATFRTPERAAQLDAAGVMPVAFSDFEALSLAVKRADGILICPPPTNEGCPAFAAVEGIDLAGKWLGYLSTTGVYGDRDGGWVFEESARLPSSLEGRRRVMAEDQWLSKGAQVFRLPGLYGAGRNVIERLRDGTARRVIKPGHVFSRLHHDDCASALMASLSRPSPGDIYNLCDDEPAAGSTIVEWAAKVFGFDMPPAIAWDNPSLPPTMQRFYADNKRVSNARAKAVLGWRPHYPTWREGLMAIQKAIS